MSTTCEHCRYLVKVETELGVFVCNRYPPSAHPVPTQNGVMNLVLSPQIPKDKAACGEYMTSPPVSH